MNSGWDANRSDGPILAPWPHVADAERAGRPQQWPIAGADGFLALSAAGGSLAVLLPEETGVAALNTGLEAVRTDTVEIDGRPFVRVYTADTSLFEQFHGFAATVLRLWLRHGVTFEDSFAQGIAQWRRLLTAADQLPSERQIGLFGELCVLRLLLDRSGTGAVHDWTGPAGDDHDFRRSACDLEVKTTTANNRVHWIHGPRQLVPAPSRRLALISVHLKKVGQGAGETLPGLVDVLRARLVDDASAATFLEEALRGLGYDDRDRALYGASYVFRSPLSVIPVVLTSGLPVLTPSLLAKALAGSEDRLGELRYEIDVDGLGVTEPGVAFWDAIDRGGADA